MQVQPGSWLPWTVLSTSCGVPGQPDQSQLITGAICPIHERFGSTLTVADFIMPATLGFLNKMIYCMLPGSLISITHIHWASSSFCIPSQCKRLTNIIVWFISVSDPHAHVYPATCKSGTVKLWGRNCGTTKTVSCGKGEAAIVSHWREFLTPSFFFCQTTH